MQVPAAPVLEEEVDVGTGLAATMFVAATAEVACLVSENALYV